MDRRLGLSQLSFYLPKILAAICTRDLQDRSCRGGLQVPRRVADIFLSTHKMSWDSTKDLESHKYRGNLQISSNRPKTSATIYTRDLGCCKYLFIHPKHDLQYVPGTYGGCRYLKMSQIPLRVLKYLLIDSNNEPRHIPGCRYLF